MNKVVISGMSCRFPESDSYQALWQNLIAHKDMLSDDNRRWPAGSFDIPRRFGKINSAEHFDAAFFGVHGKQADKMDPQLRLLLEVSYEAFMDAGIDPQQLKGSNTGVFVGACFSDMLAINGQNIESITGYENSGCSLSMFSNRLSFYYDFHGPSHTVDTACSSSIVALDAAISALNSGKCDYAVVGGSNIIFNPSVSLGFAKLKMLSPTGSCKSFDQAGDGYARAEGVAAVILTRESLAKRVRAVVLGSAVNSDGYTEKGITFPNGNAQEKLLASLYERCDINLADVSYIEAHGTGTAAGDPQEVNAIEKALKVAERKADSPLYIGSVKSNMGHAEGAAGMAGLIKVLLCMEHGLIPANLHYSKPNQQIPSLLDGTIKVVDKHLPWQGGIVGINSFGFGGTNAHVILEGGVGQPPVKHFANDNIITPLYPCTARTQQAVDQLIESYAELDDQTDVRRFIQGVANRNTELFQYRGCLVTATQEEQKTSKVFKAKVVEKPAEIWFVYPGMGSQWNGMGEELMEHPVFAQSIQALDQVLKETDINLYALLSKSDRSPFVKPSKTFVAITAIQIALTDMAKAYGIMPNGIIGHSVGEIACAYADEVISREQAILAAYYRGISIQQSPESKGKMAVAQLSWEQAQTYCNEAVVAACHNSEYSVTFSGVATAIDELVRTLQAADYEVQEVNSTGIAFHSQLVKSAAPVLTEYLSNVITQPKQRSSRWISTSRPEHEWPDAVDCSAKYFVDNLINPVLFHDALKHIPDNAIVIELGPHSLMRAALMENIRSATYINLMRRDFNCAQVFNEALAQCYVAGVDINWSGGNSNEVSQSEVTQLEQLSLPQLTGWDHSASWEIPDFEKDILRSNADFIYTIDLQSEDYGYFRDHQLHNHIVVPGLGYLYMVWQTVAKICHVPFNELKIQFSDVHFHRATMLSEQNTTDLKVRYLPVTHQFEVVDRDDLVASGVVMFGDEIVLPVVKVPEIQTNDKPIFMQTADIYKELRLRGYHYGKTFRGINSVSTDGCYLDINWNKNWVTFLDCFLQANIVRFERDTLVPTVIRKMTIDPQQQPDQDVISAYSNKYIRRMSSAAVVIEDCEFGILPSPQYKDKPRVSSMEFVPFIETDIIQQMPDSTVSEYIQLVNAYVLKQFAKLTAAGKKTTSEKGSQFAAHIKQLSKAISTCEYAEYTEPQFDKFINHPDAILLRLAQHIYQQPEQLLDDAMPLIVSFDEYNDLYKRDIAMAFLFQNRYLGNMLQIVLENMGAARPVNFCEVGTGTGGLTSHILPFLRSSEDRYKITDISAGFFENLKNEFSAYNVVTEYAPWNISASAPQSVGNQLDMVSASNVIHASPDIKQTLTNIHDSLTDGGFLLLHEATHGYPIILGIWGFIDDIWNYTDKDSRSNGAFVTRKRWLELLDDSGFDIVSMKDDGELSTLFLCRKKTTAELSQVTIKTSQIEQDLSAIQENLKLAAENNDSRLWIHGDRQSSPGLPGLINCARKEAEGSRLRAIFIDSVNHLDIENQKQPDSDIIQQMMKTDLAMSVYRDSQWGSFRYIDLPKNPPQLTDNAYMDIGIKGDLSSLHWVTSAEINTEMQVFDAAYCALNFKDIMLATGKLSATAFKGSAAKSLTCEFSGRSATGRRVMGFINDPFSTKIVLTEKEPSYIWDVPEHWTLEQAATVPVAYMTSYLALVVRADIKAGQRVLIHSGTGGVGQAAIRLALSKGCEVFTTVGSQKKRELLLSLFPEILEDHIYSSRTTDFENEIMEVTQGKGVQVILNSLADDKLQASLRVLSRYGQFLEIGKYDMTQNTPVGMQMYLRDVKFIGVGLDNVMRDDPQTLEVISTLMKQGIADGVVLPLERSVFNYDELEQAFRFMAAGKHTGKVLLKISDEELTEKSQTSAASAQASTQASTQVMALAKFWCAADKSYLITGGLGGFGFELARWLIERGAKNITLTSRSDVKNAYQTYWLTIWKNAGVSITLSKLDVSDKQQAKLLLEGMKQPLGGIFHLAMILEDAFLMNQTAESFKHVIDVKYTASLNLDELSKELCPQLDHFVCFSSLSGGAGNPGQANYGYANFAMDRLCESRKQQGLPALSIQWGAIGDVGFVSENRDLIDTEALFTKEQPLASCLKTLDASLLQDKPVISSYVRYCDIFDKSNTQQQNVFDGEKTQETLIAYIRNMLGISAETEVSEDTRFSTLGMDSLMVVEIKNKLEADYDIRLTLPAIQQLTFTSLKEMYNKQASLHEVVATTNNSAADDKITDTEVFRLFSGNSTDNNVIYFLNGFASDPVTVLSELDIPANNRVYIIRYEQAGNMDILADLWEQHILEHCASAEKIHIVGFSTGATIIHRFKNIKDLSGLPVKIDYTTISTPTDDMFLPLSAFSVESINTISEKDAMTQIRTLPWFGDFKIISQKEIIEQVKFLVTDHFYSKELSSVDKIIIPSGDKICWTVEKAKTMSQNVQQIEGVHDLKTIPLHDIMFS